MKIHRSFVIMVLILASAADVFAQRSQGSSPSDKKVPAATARGNNAGGTPPVQDKKKKNDSTDPANSSCTNPTIGLGVMSGADADSLAKTLSTVFAGRFVVSACSAKNATGGGDDSSKPGGDSSGSSSDTLQVIDPTAPSSKAATKLPPKPFQPTSSDPFSRALVDMVRILDRDNFKGGVLTSAFVVPIPDPDFARKVSEAFAHPAPDLDVELVDPFPEDLAPLIRSSCAAVSNKTCPQKTPNEHKQCLDQIVENTTACEVDWDKHPPSDLVKEAKIRAKLGSVFLVLVPSPLVLGQTAVAKTVAQDAAALKHDFEQLLDRRNSKTNVSCPAGSDEIAAERCLRENTVTLSLLDPRDVVLHAKELFDNAVEVRFFPLSHSVAILPRSQTLDAMAVEQYELYKQDQKQKQMVSLLKATSSASSTTASPTTTTTTTIKTPVPASSSGGAGQNKGAPTTVSTSITTSTSTQQASATGGASGQGSAGSGSGSGAGQGTGGASGGSAASGGSPGTGGSGGGQPATAQAQPAAPDWGIDNIVRLYDYRDATGIAAAINGMVSYAPNSRPIVQALSDFGANDMIEVLPSAAQQGGYSVGDIERAISLLDLPRPQLSLQVWSYQISAKVAHPNERYKDKRPECPKQGTRQTQGCIDESADSARTAFESINRQVQNANLQMTKALEAGLQAIFEKAQKSKPIPQCTPGFSHPSAECGLTTREDDFFAEEFREYLTMKYHDCIRLHRYCIGYFNALDFPSNSSSNATSEKYAANASLGQLILFLVAANDTVAQTLGDSTSPDSIVQHMRHELGLRPRRCSSTNPCPTPARDPEYLWRFAGQLNRTAETNNLRRLRVAFLDFFFNYKWTLNYPNDFVPYDLQRSAHTLDDFLQPIVTAFNQDIDEYVQDKLDAPGLIPPSSKAGLVNQGMVQVAALSGTPALVSGQVNNYFNITQTPALSQVAQSLLAPSGNSGGSGSSNGGGGTSGGGGGSQGSGGTSSSGGSGASSGSSSLQGLVSTNPYLVAGEALANIMAPPKITAQLSRGITLVVTPTSLATASSAELNVNLVVSEPSAPQSVNSSAATQDLLDRVSSHMVTDTVRVQSLKLFDLSTLSMEISHPQTPTCVPLAENDPGRFFSYFAAVPFSVPCAVWRSVFGSMPGASRLFEWPRLPLTVDNRSVAIIRATVVPTAMDLGEGMDFESDRVLDPVTGITESLSSISQLGWRARQFHRSLMECLLKNGDSTCGTLTLDTIPDDIRKPATN